MPRNNVKREATYSAAPKKKPLTKKTVKRVVNLQEARAKHSAKEVTDAKSQLTALLKLETVGLSIERVRVVGRGGNASADLILSDGSKVEIPTLHQFAKASWLNVELAAATGAQALLKNSDTLAGLTLIRQIADWEETASDDETARDWGISFLQEAALHSLDWNSQEQRWAKFSELKNRDPYHQAYRNRESIARHSIVLEDEVSGVRYVRCGWLKTYVSSQGVRIDSKDLNTRMQRVGWSRPNSQGRIKATPKRGGKPLSWTFYEVPKDWEAS